MVVGYHKQLPGWFSAIHRSPNDTRSGKQKDDIAILAGPAFKSPGPDLKR
tara:strand:- start:92 stop:241 length:150 start_codon:yes stop_codon:yes gene_type:complete